MARRSIGNFAKIDTTRTILDGPRAQEIDRSSFSDENTGCSHRSGLDNPPVNIRALVPDIGILIVGIHLEIEITMKGTLSDYILKIHKIVRLLSSQMKLSMRHITSIIMKDHIHNFPVSHPVTTTYPSHHPL